MVGCRLRCICPDDCAGVAENKWFLTLLGSAHLYRIEYFGAWSMCTCTDVQRFESLAEDGII